MKKPTSAVIVMARCRTTRRSFAIRFEETHAGHWIADWAFALQEDVSRKEGYDQTTIAGSFAFHQEYPGCPHCHADSIVKCGCGKTACWNQQSTTFTCPWCGGTGEIRGTIESMSAGSDR